LKYKLNEKVINIPDKDIKNLMEALELSEEEAIETWLSDNDYISDETVEELTTKAKENRITATIHEAKAETAKKERKPREKKENLVKKQVINAIFAGLSENLPENVEITITNDEKYIDFIMNGIEFTVNLVQHRAKKTH